MTSKRKAGAAHRRLVLPNADDISPVFASSWTASKLDRLIEYVRAGRPVWWRREGFHNEPFRGTDPKWHILVGRTRGDESNTLTKWDFTWKAACGYRRVHPEILFGMLDFKVGAPKIDDRCEKCSTLYAGHLAERRRDAARTKESDR